MDIRHIEQTLCIFIWTLLWRHNTCRSISSGRSEERPVNDNCFGLGCAEWREMQTYLLQVVLGHRPSPVEIHRSEEELHANPYVEEDLDILFTPNDAKKIAEQTSQSKVRVKRKIKNFKDLPRNKWDVSMSIPYKLEGFHIGSNDQEIKWIRHAFNVWQNITCVTFEEVSRGAVIQRPHLRVTRSPMCASYIGIKDNLVPYEAQPLMVGLQCLSREKVGRAIHEIGHVLGLWHEHQRPIRDNFVDVQPSDNDDLFAHVMYLGNYIKRDYTDVYEYGLPYDYNSIMHYGPHSHAGFIAPRDPLFTLNIGQRIEPSFLDAFAINKEYCEVWCSQPLPFACLHGGYQDPLDCKRCRCPDGLDGERCDELQPTSSGCSSKILLDVGDVISISSPGYAEYSGYPEFEECNWLIEVPVGYVIGLHFVERFGIPALADNTCHEWIEVQVHDNFGVPGYRFCGSDRPAARIMSTGEKMLLKFRSRWDLNLERIGFKAILQAVRQHASPVEIHKDPGVSDDGGGVTATTDGSIQSTSTNKETPSHTSSPSSSVIATSTFSTSATAPPSISPSTTTLSKSTTVLSTSISTTAISTSLSPSMLSTSSSSSSSNAMPSTTMSSTSTATQLTSTSTASSSTPIRPTSTSLSSSTMLSTSTLTPSSSSSSLSSSSSSSTQSISTTATTSLYPSTSLPSSTSQLTTPALSSTPMLSSTTFIAPTTKTSTTSINAVSPSTTHSMPTSTASSASSSAEDDTEMSEGETVTWSQWEASQTTSCNCGGCNYVIRYKLCSGRRCTGADAAIEEGERVLRLCTSTDVRTFWVGRMLNRPCTKIGQVCCAGYVIDESHDGFCRLQ